MRRLTCSITFVLAAVTLGLAPLTAAQQTSPSVIDFIEDVGLLSFQSNSEDSHLRVEYVPVPGTNRYQVAISSTTGPIRYFNRITNESYSTTEPIVLDAGVARFRDTFLTIRTGGGNDSIELVGKFQRGTILADWAGVEVATDNGADDVLIEGVFTNWMGLSTGGGADRVTLRDCRGRLNDSQFSELAIDTGNGNDLVAMFGYNDFLSVAVDLGRGSDVLVGDSEGEILAESWLTMQGGIGSDALVNSHYFRYASRPWAFAGFELID